MFFSSTEVDRTISKRREEQRHNVTSHLQADANQSDVDRLTRYGCVTTTPKAAVRNHVPSDKERPQ